MRTRLPLLASVLAAALALPGAAQAAGPVVADLPCVDATVASAGCAPGPNAAPTPKPEPMRSCSGRDVVPTVENVAVVLDATLCLLNERRGERGLGTLKPVGSLQAVASAYAKRMVSERFFEHTAPDGSNFLTRIKRTSYLKGSIRRWSVGENIAWATGELATPEAIVLAWMRSPGHKRNILNGRFTELGLGVAIGAPQSGAGGAAATYVNEFGERQR